MYNVDFVTSVFISVFTVEILNIIVIILKLKEYLLYFAQMKD